MVIVDRGNQTKIINAVTILDYNKTTIFGIDQNGKKTWLGKYDTSKQAQLVCYDIEKAIESGTEKYIML